MLHCPRNIMRTVAYCGLFLATGLVSGPGRGSDRRLAGGGRRRQHPGRRMQRQHVGRGRMGEDARRPRQEQSRSLETEQADPGHADPDRHEEETCRRCSGKAKSITPRTARSTARRSSRVGTDQLEIQGLRAGLSLRRRDLDPRRAADSLEPRQQHGQGRAEGHGAPAQGRGSRTAAGRAEDHRLCRPAHQVRQSRRPGSPATVGDICLLPDIARFAH